MRNLAYFLLFFISIGCKTQTEFSVLQFNIWQEGTVIEGGFDAIADEIIRLNADLVALSEVRNYNNEPFSEKLVNALKEKGHI